MAHSGQWYLIYRYRWIGLRMRMCKWPVDGVFASNSDAAIEKALSRINHRTDERFAAEWCATAAQRQIAAELDGRHECEWWGKEDFNEFIEAPAFQGDDSKYLVK